MPFSRRLVALGLSYHTASVDLRERARCTLTELDHVRRTDARFSAIVELAVISTCNRLEIYAAIEEFVDGSAQSEMPDPDLLPALLATTCGVGTDQLVEHTYSYSGLDAQNHLARVAAGLESMVLGEPQILGQVSTAYEEAVACRSMGPMVTAAMRSALRAGKRAHSETQISRKPASISSVAVAMAATRLPHLAARTVIVVGVGEMGLQTLKALQARRVMDVTVVNRTLQKAEQVAAPFGFRWAGLDQLPELMAGADLVVSATGADSVVISRSTVRTLMERRTARPLYLIDIALPRDIDPAVESIPGVELADIDQLTASFDEAREARLQEVPKVEAIIADESARFSVTMQQLSVEPIIADLRRKAESIRQREVERTLRFMGEDTDPETVKHIQHMTRALVNKLLHDPTITLKQKASDGDGHPYAEAVQELFALSTEPGR